MNIGYARVSADDQNPDLQLAALKKVGCKRTFIEKATGAHVKRTELTRCLKTLAAGDTLIVWKLDQLGRSLRSQHFERWLRLTLCNKCCAGFAATMPIVVNIE